MSVFARFPEAVSMARSGNQAAIDQATAYIKNECDKAPGFGEYLVTYMRELCAPGADPNSMLMAAITLKDFIKSHWDIDTMFADKGLIRNSLIQFVLLGIEDIRITSQIIDCIGLIARSDYARRWPDLMRTLVSALGAASPQVLLLILQAATAAIKHFERESLDTIERDWKHTIDCWQEELTRLILHTLPANLADTSGAAYACMEAALTLFEDISKKALPDFVMENLPGFFRVFGILLTGPDPKLKLKVRVCSIMKTYIIRFSTEISQWGQSRENPRPDEERAAVRGLWEQLMAGVMGVLAEHKDNALTTMAFEALGALARSRDRGIFLENDNLAKICSNVLVPNMALNEEDEYNFTEDPLTFFDNDINGMDTEGRYRQAAYMFLKHLTRNFQGQLVAVFQGWCDSLCEKCRVNPAENWKNMDTAIFIMTALSAKINFTGVGVKAVHDGVNVIDLVNRYILPHMDPSGSFPILQADALKFVVDFRLILPHEFIATVLWPRVIGLLLSSCPAVVFYATYCVDQLCGLADFPECQQLLATCEPNLGGIVKRMFDIFTIGGSETTPPQNNVSAIKCVARLMSVSGPVIQPFAIEIVNRCVEMLKSQTGVADDPDCRHFLFETLAAAVTRAGVPAGAMEGCTVDLITMSLTMELVDYVPYIFQLLSCYMLSYPEGAPLNDFYSAHFGNFLQNNLWISMGNIPGLTMLIMGYCMKAIPLIIANFERIMEICSLLLKGTRTHPYALRMLWFIIQNVTDDQIVACLTPIITKITEPIVTDQTCLKYEPNIAVFMSKLCHRLPPDVIIQSMHPHMLAYWSEGLTKVHGRRDIEWAVSGSLKFLCEATTLNDEQWTGLFRGLVMMMESPASTMFAMEVEVYRQEEKDAQEFDATFSPLTYASCDHLLGRADLRGIDLIEYLARGLSQYSITHPGRLERAAAAALPVHVQGVFRRWAERYSVAFQ